MLVPVKVRDVPYDFTDQPAVFAELTFVPLGPFRPDASRDRSYYPIPIGPVGLDGGEIVATLVAPDSEADDPVRYRVETNLGRRGRVITYEITMPVVPDTEGLVLELADRDSATGDLPLPGDVVVPGDGGFGGSGGGFSG